ncbi:MAG TPA: hypothetical protein VKR53_03360 [Puia sp.]|nr:hypothetical protein [Puia sp.]
MSTLTYAALTTRREKASPGTSRSSSSPGVKTYVDAFAALVPAEVLSLHALIISYTTTTTADKRTTITDAGSPALHMAFYGLIVISIILYVSARIKGGQWDSWDYCRALIPPLAFVGWTMLQRSTAFDAVWPALSVEQRTTAALLLSVLLAGAASALAFQVDKKPINQMNINKAAAK